MGLPEVDGGIYIASHAGSQSIADRDVMGTITARMFNTLGTRDVEEGALLPVAPAWPAQIAPTLHAHYGSKQGLEDQHALGGAGLFVPTVAIGTDCYNGDITGNVAATMGTPGSSVNASGPTAMVAHTLRSNGFDASEDGTGRGVPLGATAFNARQDPDVSGSMTHPLDTDGHSVAIALQTMQVRRLTPVECERLQGFPDGYTDIRPRGKDTPDGPRYKALGNSMAVPVMRWIGERIDKVDRM